MAKLILLWSFLLLPLGFDVRADDELPPVRTVPSVSIQRYMGQWYEIASIPQRFQKGCTTSTANYRLREDGKVEVINQCRLGSPDGEIKTAKGVAYAVDETNSKLRVSFFWPFYGDYWIVDLGQNYEFAVVGSPGRDYLWVLSRTPAMEKEVYSGLLGRLRQQYFDLSKLRVTGQVTEKMVSEN